MQTFLLRKKGNTSVLPYLGKTERWPPSRKISGVNSLLLIISRAFPSQRKKFSHRLTNVVYPQIISLTHLNETNNPCNNSTCQPNKHCKQRNHTNVTWHFIPWTYVCLQTVNRRLSGSVRENQPNWSYHIIPMLFKINFAGRITCPSISKSSR